MNAACSTTILSIVLLAIAFHTSILLYIRAIFIFTFYSCDFCNLYFLDPVSLGFDGIIGWASDNLYFVLPVLAAMILLIAGFSTCRVRKNENFPDSMIFVAKTFRIKRLKRINFQIRDKYA